MRDEVSELGTVGSRASRFSSKTTIAFGDSIRGLV